MQDDFAAMIACIKELFGMFPPGQQAKVDQLRGNIAALEEKYAAGVTMWDQNPPPPIP